MWSSPHSGWHAQSAISNEPFTPTRNSLLFIQLFNAPAEHAGFNVAFFSSNIAVNSMGHVLCVPSEPFEAMVQLAQHTFELPDAGSYRNTWRVKHERSSFPIRRLLVKAHSDDVLKETSVYGYEKDKWDLENETRGSMTLPSILMELFGLLEEARQGYRRGHEDSSVIDAIKALI